MSANRCRTAFTVDDRKIGLLRRHLTSVADCLDDNQDNEGEVSISVMGIATLNPSYGLRAQSTVVANISDICDLTRIALSENSQLHKEETVWGSGFEDP